MKLCFHSSSEVLVCSSTQTSFATGGQGFIRDLLPLIEPDKSSRSPYSFCAATGPCGMLHDQIPSTSPLAENWTALKCWESKQTSSPESAAHKILACKPSNAYFLYSLITVGLIVLCTKNDCACYSKRRPMQGMKMPLLKHWKVVDVA